MGTAQGAGGAAPQQARGERGGGRLGERHFRRVDKFDGHEPKWKERPFQIKTAIATVNPKMRTLLDEIQKDQKEVDWDLVFGNLTDEQQEHMGAELYGLLVQMTTG